VNPAPQVARSGFAHAADALGSEWLISNGLGGFAAGTVAQANTRRYHGLLVAALRPPLQRTLLVSKVDATARYRDREFALGCNEFADGTLTPRGFEALSSFEFVAGLPLWSFALGDALLEQRIWMAHGHNTAYLSFTLRQSSAPLDLQLLPLCTYRDYHAHSHGGWPLTVEPNAAGCTITAFAGARPYRLGIDCGRFCPGGEWYWQFRHRLEAERGLDALEDLFRPGVFRARLAAGETVALSLTAEPEEPEAAGSALERELARRRSLLRAAPEPAPPWIRQLTLAADAFIVRRAGAHGQTAGTTVLAGYPWFGDWGRDTMIALPGLALCTGRTAEAASILRTFATHASQGMLPNRFPEGGEAPEYNTADATLWYFHAVAAYLESSADRALLRDLYPVLADIIAWHERGTRYSIHLDRADGLLHAGEPGVQLTWMDAKFGDWVITPRIGKPVEINALWHFALTQMASWARVLGDPGAAAGYARAAARVAATFAEAFWFEAGGYLYDVIDTPDGEPDERGRRVDRSLRPNQIFAISLGSELLNAQQARAVVDCCSRELLTPVGLRSLSPHAAQYAAHYSGGPRERDALYHQGTIWSWLLGPFALAHYRVYGNAEHACALLAGLAPHLGEACLGTISEIFDGDAPHQPRGCFAQAWSVAETLRAWYVLAGASR